MFKQNTTKRIITYLIIVFAVSSILYVLFNQNGGLEGVGELYVLPFMWAPAVAALITTFIFQRNMRGLGWGLGKPVYYLIAFLLPILYAGIAYGIVWLLGLGVVGTSALGGNFLVTRFERTDHRTHPVDFSSCRRRDRLAWLACSPISSTEHFHTHCADQRNHLGNLAYTVIY